VIRVWEQRTSVGSGKREGFGDVATGYTGMLTEPTVAAGRADRTYRRRADYARGEKSGTYHHSRTWAHPVKVFTQAQRKRPCAR
jgi:hypothetical protein